MKLKWIPQSKGKELFYTVDQDSIKVYNVSQGTELIMVRLLQHIGINHIDFELQTILIRVESMRNTFKVRIINIMNILIEEIVVQLEDNPQIFQEINHEMIIACTSKQLIIIDIKTGNIQFKQTICNEVKQILVNKNTVYVLYENGLLQEYSVLNFELDLLQTLNEIQQIQVINDTLIYRANKQVTIKGMSVMVQQQSKMKKILIKNSSKELLLIFQKNQKSLIIDEEKVFEIARLQEKHKHQCHYFGEQLNEVINIFQYQVYDTFSEIEVNKEYLAPLLESNETKKYEILKANIDNIFTNNGVLNPEIELQMEMPSKFDYNKGEFVFDYLFEKYPQLLLKMVENSEPHNVVDLQRFIYYLCNLVEKTKKYSMLELLIDNLMQKIQKMSKTHELQETLIKLKLKTKSLSIAHLISRSSITNQEIIQKLKNFNLRIESCQTSSLCFIQYFYPKFEVLSIPITTKEQLLSFILNTENQYILDYFVIKFDLTLSTSKRQIIQEVLQTENETEYSKLVRIVSKILKSDETDVSVFKYLIDFCTRNHYTNLALIILYSQAINWKQNQKYIIENDCLINMNKLLYDIDILRVFNFSGKQIEHFLLSYFQYLEKTENLRPLQQYPIGKNNMNIMRPLLKKISTLYF